MAGVQPFDEEDLKKIVASFKGRMGARDACLFTLQLFTSYRITEVLSLHWSDVYRAGQFAPRIVIRKRFMKKKTRTNSTILNPIALHYLKAWFDRAQQLGNYSPEFFLFGQQNQPGKAISRTQVYRVYNNAAARAGLFGRFGTHSPRKNHINRGHQDGGCNPAITMKLSHHVRMDSLVSYLDVDQAKADDIVMNMTFGLNVET